MTRPPRSSGPSRPPEDDDEKGMGPTRIRDLAAVAVIVGVATWVLVSYNYDTFPSIPLLAGIALYVLAAIEIVVAFIIRSRISSHQIGPASGQLHPIAAARIVALAKASAILGALSVGAWAGILAFLLAQNDLAQADHDKPSTIVAGIGGLVLVGAALWLEYCCRAPDDPPPDALGDHPGPA